MKTMTTKPPKTPWPPPLDGATGDMLDLLKLGALGAYLGGFVSETVAIVSFFLFPVVLVGLVALVAKRGSRTP